MQFTPEQIQALDSGQPVPLSVEGRPCVLMPGALYERFLEAVDDWHPAAMRQHVANIMAEDWNDPRMNVYDE